VQNLGNLSLLHGLRISGEPIRPSPAIPVPPSASSTKRARSDDDDDPAKLRSDRGLPDSAYFDVPRISPGQLQTPFVSHVTDSAFDLTQTSVGKRASKPLSALRQNVWQSTSPKRRRSFLPAERSMRPTLTRRPPLKFARAPPAKSRVNAGRYGFKR
jgi:hypothetical protein